MVIEQHSPELVVSAFQAVFLSLVLSSIAIVNELIKRNSDAIRFMTVMASVGHYD